MVKEHIRLEDAMTLELKQPFRTWSVFGLHVEDKDIPEDADVKATFVSKSPDKCLAVGVDFTNAKGGWNLGFIAEFSSLEELRKTFPQLFELEGELFAFP